MPPTILHYIYDPLCGWCYGAEGLVAAAATVGGLELRLHAGGLWPQPTNLPEEMRRYIREADSRIAAMSGQPFGEAYLSGLLEDPALVLHSRPTIAAVLAAQSLDAGQALQMLRAIQHAHYERGRRVVEPEVLADLAAECGLDREAFAAALAAVPVDAHIDETRRLMSRIGAGGFPTFVLEAAGAWLAVPHQRYPGDPGGFRNWLSNQLQTRASAASSGRLPSPAVRSNSTNNVA